MKVNKLDNEIFYDFASQLIGIDVKLFKHDLELKRTEQGLKLKVYLGGEREDLRECFFQDCRCVYKNYVHGSTKQDVSYDWVCFVIANADELTAKEKKELVDAYNANLEDEIQHYAKQKREHLINM